MFFIERIQLNISNSILNCPTCLYNTAHPFGLSVYSYGCSGCETHKEKERLNWTERLEKLKSLLEPIKKKRGRQYDCVVPVQGDAEDYYVMTLVNELGLTPLVVCVNDYFFNDIGWHNLHNLITYFDVDSLVYNPDLYIYKEMVRNSLRKLNHLMWPALALKTSFPVHIAKQRKIPLVVWGQNQAVEQTGKFSHLDEVKMSAWSRREHDILRNNVDKIIGSGAQVEVRKLNYYRYPDLRELGHGKVEGIYLSNYFRWDPLLQNRQSTDQGLIPQRQNSTFDIYERAGSSVYYQLHDLLKLSRCGYRKVSDHLTREIRHNRISRQEAKSLASEYSKTKVDVDEFFKWLGVTKSGVEWFTEKRLRNVNHLIGRSAEVSIKLPLEIAEFLKSEQTPTQNYIAFGKGISL